jgi:hypothetical protein
MPKVAFSRDSLDIFTRAYIGAAMATTTDEESGGDLDSSYDIEDFAPETLEAIIADCKKFQQENAEALAEHDDEQGGTDFWLTRNGHGAGFWDGDWAEGDKLTFAAKQFGEADIYVGDNGRIYQMGTETQDTPPHEDFAPSGYDQDLMKSMGVQASIKSQLLFKKEPKLAFGFEDGERQYDFEPNGNDVVLIAPSNTTMLLEGDSARQFWVNLDSIEEKVPDEPTHVKEVQFMIKAFFDKDIKAANAKYVIQVNATSLKKAAVTYVASVEGEERVEKFKFTSSREKAITFSRTAAERIHAQLADFNLTGKIDPA